MALDFVMHIEPSPVNTGGWPETAAFRGYTAPVRIEVDVSNLEVVGTIPPELDGA